MKRGVVCQKCHHDNWRKRSDYGDAYQCHPCKIATRVSKPDWKPLTRWYSYRKRDKESGHSGTLSKEDAFRVMAMSCRYCGGDGGGLDRIDFHRGHTKDNVVPSCHRCNHLLGDLPFAAKELMAPALRKLRESGLVDGWLPPILRDKQGGSKYAMKRVA